MNGIGFSEYLLLSAWFGCAVWLCGLFWTIYCLKKQPVLGTQKKNFLPEEKFLSILVPVRNEANRILEKSISSMLTQTYKNYEVVVLNDRSTDNTREILENLQFEISNFKFQIIDGNELPKDWLGKPHALQQAFETAQGEWILTTDADVIFAPETLQTAVKYAEKNNFDALTLMPKQDLKSFWEEFFMPVFSWLGLLIRPFHRVNNPKLKTFCGIGNFFLMRRNILDKIGGFESVKNEVAEDLKLAEIIKKKGFNLQIEYAPNLIETRMYKGFSEIWEGFTKNFFAGMNHSLLKAINGGFWVLLMGVLPFFLAIWTLFSGNFLFFLPLFLTYLLQVSTLAILRFYFESKVFYAVFAPFGFVLFLAILANSTIKILSGKGVKWKERAIYGKNGI